MIGDNSEVGKNLTNHRFLAPLASVPEDDNKGVAGNLAFKEIALLGAIPLPGDTDLLGRPILLDRPIEYATINVAPGVAVLVIILNRPKSRGFQTIFNKDPLAEMIVDPQYLSEPEDISALVIGLEIMEKAINKLPGYAIDDDISDPMNYVLNNATHVHHYSGTNAIRTVVDENLHVLGTENLMVVDVSISPTTVRGHTFAAGVLIGAVGYTIITGDKKVAFD